MTYPEFKSPEHRAAISEGMKRHHLKQRQLRDVIDRLDFVLLANGEKGLTAASTIDELVAALLGTLKTFVMEQGDARERAEKAKIAEDRWRQEAYSLRGKLHAAGQNVRAMDGFELRALGRKGLVDQGLVDEEMKRRVQDGIFEGRPPGHDMVASASGAAVSGYLPCGAHGCGVMVDVADGSYCSKHLQAAPRSWIDGSYTARNLDFELANAEQKLTRAKREIDQAAAEVRDLKKQVEAYDDARRTTD